MGFYVHENHGKVMEFQYCVLQDWISFGKQKKSVKVLEKSWTSVS